MNLGHKTTEVAAAWKVAAASVVGRTHQYRGKPCQDAYAWDCLTDGTLVLAVADGVGEARQSEIGSAIAVRTAVDAARVVELPDWPDGDDGLCPTAAQQIEVQNLAQQKYGHSLNEILVTVNAAIIHKAGALGVPSHDLATTLVLSVVKKNCVVTLQVGDGWTVVRDNLEGLLVNGAASDHECINVTDALPHSAPCLVARGWFLPVRVTRVALHTDGLQWVALQMPQGRPHGPFFDPLFRFVEQAHAATASAELESFLRSSRVTAALDDDLTLLVACPEQPRADGEENQCLLPPTGNRHG